MDAPGPQAKQGKEQNLPESDLILTANTLSKLSFCSKAFSQQLITSELTIVQCKVAKRLTRVCDIFTLKIVKAIMSWKACFNECCSYLDMGKEFTSRVLIVFFRRLISCFALFNISFCCWHRNFKPSMCLSLWAFSSCNREVMFRLLRQI